jgi:hypothetical protein
MRTVSCDRHHAKIELGSESAIEPNLFITRATALLQRREIEKAEVERFFQFVGIWPGEQNIGNMGLDVIDMIHRVRVAGGVKECLNQPSIIAGRGLFARIVSGL